MDVSQEMDWTNFDPLNQQLIAYYPDGSNFTLSLADVDMHYYDNVGRAVIYAIQTGAAFMVLVFLLVLTRREKMRAPLFWINVFSVLILLVRSIMHFYFYLSDFSRTYNVFSYDFSYIRNSHWTTSYVTTMMDLILQISVLLSLLFQVRAVYTSERIIRMVATMVTGFFALLAIGTYFAWIILFIKSTQAMRAGVENPTPSWLLTMVFATYAFSISLFSAIFLAKLGLAIRKRRQLGLKQFGALQVIFVIGCQTLVLPAICLILECFVDFQGLSSCASSLLALLLPLSSLWATAQTNSDSPTGISGGRFTNDSSSKGLLNTASSRATYSTYSTAKAQGDHSEMSMSSSSNKAMMCTEEQEMTNVKTHHSYNIDDDV